MKSLTILVFLVHFAGLATAACQRMGYVHLTFYGYPDNNPPSADTAYNCGGRNNTAGRTGTYDDPVTFGSAEGEFNECETVYIPYLEKYARCKSLLQSSSNSSNTEGSEAGLVLLIWCYEKEMFTADENGFR